MRSEGRMRMKSMFQESIESVGQGRLVVLVGRVVSVLLRHTPSR